MYGSSIRIWDPKTIGPLRLTCLSGPGRKRQGSDTSKEQQAIYNEMRKNKCAGNKFISPQNNGTLRGVEKG